jgi:hypothetical protein
MNPQACVVCLSPIRISASLYQELLCAVIDCALKTHVCVSADLYVYAAWHRQTYACSSVGLSRWTRIPSFSKCFECWKHSKSRYFTSWFFNMFPWLITINMAANDLHCTLWQSCSVTGHWRLDFILVRSMPSKAVFKHLSQNTLRHPVTESLKTFEKPGSMRSMRSMRGGIIFRNRGPSLKVHPYQCRACEAWLWRIASRSRI